MVYEHVLEKLAGLRSLGANPTACWNYWVSATLPTACGSPLYINICMGVLARCLSHS